MNEIASIFKQENQTIGKMIIYTFHKCDFLKFPPLWDFVYSVTRNLGYFAGSNLSVVQSNADAALNFSSKFCVHGGRSFLYQHERNVFKEISQGLISARMTCTIVLL